MIKECKICGKEFIPNKYSNNQIYCCRKCAKKAYYLTPKGNIQRKNSLKRVMFKYHRNKDYRKKMLESSHKYVTSEKGKNNKGEYRKKYRKTGRGKLVDLKYRQSEKRKKSLTKYTHSIKGKANGLRGSLKRITRLKKVIHNFTYDEWLQKIKNTFGVCPRCNKYIGINKLTLDHIIPISKVKEGQVYTINDVQPLCKHCNTSKNNKVEL